VAAAVIADLAGRTAVITGGASGLGLAFARRFGAEGANLVVADIEAAALERAAAELAEAGYPTLAVPTDVADLAAIEALERAATAHFGPVHVLCNNAGVVATGRVEEISLRAWQWVMDVNLWAVINGCRVFLPAMLAHGEAAHIVNTASMAGLDAGPLMAPYYVTKFGVVALTESIWHEQKLARTNVSASVLCPGFVRTRIAEPDRNAPAGVRTWVAEGSERGAGFAALLRAGVEGGKEPAEIAEAVREAIAEDRFWILPHGPDGSWESVRRRADAIIDGAAPEARWQDRLGNDPPA
jgi:NAD(P)-dependent dehydrogenase (short-subunit alcohol dehydrogenase family)